MMSVRSAEYPALANQAGAFDEYLRFLLEEHGRPSSPADVAEAKRNLLGFFRVVEEWASDRMEKTKSRGVPEELDVAREQRVGNGRVRP